MRIIAGKARGIPLISGGNEACRPTTDRLKETLFNMIGPIEGEVVVDLYAGSGALGLEAWSRGASQVILVENHRQAQKAIRTNINKVGKSMNSSGEEVKVIGGSVDSFLKGSFFGLRPGLILADPPYAAAKEVIEKLLNCTELYKAASEGALLVVEHPKMAALQGTAQWNFLRSKFCGETTFSFWQKSC